MKKRLNKGYRKLALAVILTIIAVYLAIKGVFNEVISEFLRWIYGIFTAGNAIEHITRKYEREKRDISDDINSLSGDELKRTAEMELRNR